MRSFVGPLHLLRGSTTACIVPNPISKLIAKAGLEKKKAYSQYHHPPSQPHTSRSLPQKQSITITILLFEVFLTRHCVQSGSPPAMTLRPVWFTSSHHTSPILAQQKQEIIHHTITKADRAQLFLPQSSASSCLGLIGSSSSLPAPSYISAPLSIIRFAAGTSIVESRNFAASTEIPSSTAPSTPRYVAAVFVKEHRRDRRRLSKALALPFEEAIKPHAESPHPSLQELSRHLSSPSLRT
ncbi:hypothetical protein BDZ45DRAFT_735625 [Acephala macrosclerotiorum]|nr:hypothetical protein BDZ45DRAFT_735625 [Acephala macrosclerotiorum]